MSAIQDESSIISDGASNSGNKRRIGSLAGERTVSGGYDFDKSNAEIAEMFGVDDFPCAPVSEKDE